MKATASTNWVIEQYKGWNIEPCSYWAGRFEAYDPNDCDAPLLKGKTIEDIKDQIDEQLD